MNEFEDIARQRLTLVVDNPFPRRMPPRPTLLERLAYLAGLVGMVAFVLGFWWGVSVLILSLERAF